MLNTLKNYYLNNKKIIIFILIIFWLFELCLLFLITLELNKISISFGQFNWWNLSILIWLLTPITIYFIGLFLIYFYSKKLFFTSILFLSFLELLILLLVCDYTHYYVIDGLNCWGLSFILWIVSLLIIFITIIIINKFIHLYNDEYIIDGYETFSDNDGDIYVHIYS